MTYYEIVTAANKLDQQFPNEDVVTLGNMLGSLDSWINSQSWYIQLFVDMKKGE